MSWVKIDDHANEHRKQAAAGPAACWLWVCGLMWCNRQERRTGVVPPAVIPMLFPGASKKLADRLVEVGLWIVEPDGYRIHNYFEFQPTAEEIAERKVQRSEAGRRGGVRSGEARREAKTKQVASICEAKGQANANGIEANTNPDPDPDPDPNKNETSIQDLERHGGKSPSPSLVDDEEAAKDRETQKLARQLEYQAAYERGVAKGKGGPYAMPGVQRAELHQAIVTFARAQDGTRMRGDALLEWVEAAGEDFASWLVHEAATKAAAVGWYSSYGPKGLLKFLNEQERTVEARRVQ